LSLFKKQLQFVSLLPGIVRAIISHLTTDDEHIGNDSETMALCIDWATRTGMTAPTLSAELQSSWSRYEMNEIKVSSVVDWNDSGLEGHGAVQVAT
jgi:hypothetical protein